MSSDATLTYDEFYRRRDPEHVYPVEFVVRVLGAYPRLPRFEPPPQARGCSIWAAATAVTCRCCRTWA